MTTGSLAMSSRGGEQRWALPEVLLAASLTVLGTVAAPAVRRAAGTTRGKLRITVPAVFFASTDISAGVVFGKENLLVAS